MAIVESIVYAVRLMLNVSIVCATGLIMAAFLWPELQIFSILMVCIEQSGTIAYHVFLFVRAFVLIVGQFTVAFKDILMQIFRGVIPPVISVSKIIYTRGPDYVETFLCGFKNIVDNIVEFIRKEKQICIGIWALVLTILWIISTALKRTKSRPVEMRDTCTGNDVSADDVGNDSANKDGLLGGTVGADKCKGAGANNGTYIESPGATGEDEVNKIGSKVAFARLYPDLSGIEADDVTGSSVDTVKSGKEPGPAKGSVVSDEERELKEVEDKNEENLCVVCIDNKRSVAVFPCGHVHLCKSCIRSVVNGNNMCPICQSPVIEYRTVFL